MALDAAKEGDCVLIAGKVMTFQEVQYTAILDDRKVAGELLQGKSLSNNMRFDPGNLAEWGRKMGDSAKS